MEERWTSICDANWQYLKLIVNWSLKSWWNCGSNLKKKKSQLSRKSRSNIAVKDNHNWPKKGTFDEAEASKVPPPNPVRGVPFKEDITDSNIGSTSWLTASSGFEWTHAQQSSPTSATAPGRIFVLTNLEIFFKAYWQWRERQHISQEIVVTIKYF